jgi:hypothetical protein
MILASKGASERSEGKQLLGKWIWGFNSHKHNKKIAKKETWRI